MLYIRCGKYHSVATILRSSNAESHIHAQCNTGPIKVFQKSQQMLMSFQLSTDWGKGSNPSL